MTDAVIVLTTVADNDQAEALAQRLVDERLAACVNLCPLMTSFYRWKGVVERDSERQMVIKTVRAQLPALQARIRELHSYDLPEFVVLTVDDGSAEYLKWIGEQVG